MSHTLYAHQLPYASCHMDSAKMQRVCCLDTVCIHSVMLAGLLLSNMHMGIATLRHALLVVYTHTLEALHNSCALSNAVQLVMRPFTNCSVHCAQLKALPNCMCSGSHMHCAALVTACGVLDQGNCILLMLHPAALGTECLLH